jgi:large subunit ribosomal protein L25
MAEQIQAQVRDSFGKGAARKLRAAGKIPAVLYGHGSEPQHVSLPGHEVALILRRANAVLELDIAGTTQLALVKDVQKDPVRQIIEHLDLVLIRSGERVQIEVAVHVEGEPQAGMIVAQDATTLTLEAEATHIPERLTVSVEGLGEGVHITAADITLPQGSVLISAPETLVIAIGGQQDADLGESAEVPAEADAAADNG